MWCSIVARRSAGTSTSRRLGHLGRVGLDARALPDLGRETVARARGAAQVVELSPVDAAQDRIEHREVRDHVGDVAADAISRSAWRFTNEGSRMCTRAGLAEPSATTKQPSSPRGPSIGT